MVFAHDNLRPPTEAYFPPSTVATCFNVNQIVVLQATPKTGYTFSRWAISGGAGTYNGSSNPYSIKMPSSLTATRVVAYFTGGTAPTDQMAQAGPDRTVIGGDLVTLDGSRSSYPDGTITSYLWEQTSGQSVVLSGAATSRPSFTAPYVQQGGDTLVFRLTVTNNNNVPDTDTVNINVQWVNTSTLTADAGEDQSVHDGDTVTLDGSDSSDSEGQIAGYRWAVARAHPSIDLSKISLSDPSDAITSFIAPNARGWVEFRLTVTNTDGDDASDLVMISISNASGGAELVADAGPDQVVAIGDLVQLAGSWASPDDTAITHQWKQMSGPPIRLSGSDEMAPGASREVSPTFTAPYLSTGQETLGFQFIVKDASGRVATDDVAITVCSPDYINASRPPVADAGEDQAVLPGAKISLDASNSSDPEGKPLLYQWSIASSTGSIVLIDKYTAKPAFVVPSGSGSVTIELLVTDDATHTDTDTVDITWANALPETDAGPDQAVSEGEQVALYGSGSSDPDDGIASYRWEQVSGPPATIFDASQADPVFYAPAVNTDSEILTFELTVTDCGGQTSKDQVQITVNNINSAPVANAGEDQQVTEKTNVILTGSGSSDPNGDALSYQWIQTGSPTVTLSNASSQNPTFTAPSVTSEPVILTFSLAVKDDEGLVSTDDITVTVLPSAVPPVADAGPDQLIVEGKPVTLDASGSSDAAGEEGIKSYLWEHEEDGIEVILSDPAAKTTTFDAPKISQKTVVLKFKLTVENYNGVKNSDWVDITVDNKSSGGGGCFISSVTD